MKTKRPTATALGVAILFGVVMTFDPKEAADHPHLHQEPPTVPMLESQAAIITTFTETNAYTISQNGPMPVRDFE